MKNKISQLFINPPENERGSINIYISEPTPLEEKNFGTIFSIIDIDALDNTNEEVIELINEEITQNYYRSADLEIDLAFENTLNLLNRKLQQVISELGEDWLKKVNASIGVLKNGELHFSQIGSLNILLLQKEKIIKLSDNKYSAPNPLKIFSNISSGKLNNNASIIFCTESVLDYISQEKIKKILQDNDPAAAANYLQDLLNENNNATNFGAIVMKMSTQTNILKDEASTIKTSNDVNHIETEKKDSMNKLVSQEATTDELLTPSLWPTLKKNLAQWKEKTKTTKLSEPEPVTSPLKEKNSAEKKWDQVWNIIKKILIVLKNLSAQILTSIMWLSTKTINLFKQRKEYSSKFNTLPNKTSGFIAKTISWFKNLSTPRKAFIILFIIILFLFSQSIIRQGKKQETKQEQKQYEQTITDINNKLGEADTKIIMNDYAGARTLAKEANSMLDTIPKDSKTWTEKSSEAKNKIASIQDQVSFVERVNDVQSIANFSTISEDINKIALIGSNIFTFAKNSDAVYRFDLESNEATTSVAATETKSFQAITKDSAATALAIMNDQTFVQFNPVLEKLSNLSMDFPNQDVDITSLAIFGSRLYSLDKKNNQIFKNTKKGDAYDTASVWIEDDSVDLKNAVSLAVDGAIYVLKDNGKIIRLFGGVKDNDWQLEEIQPSLNGAIKIYTDENTANIYVLNPTQNRVVIFDKEGKLKKQYASDNWNNLKDMEVIESESKLYLLNNTDVFEIHLNLQ